MNAGKTYAKHFEQPTYERVAAGSLGSKARR